MCKCFDVDVPIGRKKKMTKHYRCQTVNYYTSAPLSVAMGKWTRETLIMRILRLSIIFHNWIIDKSLLSLSLRTNHIQTSRYGFFIYIFFFNSIYMLAVLSNHAMRLHFAIHLLVYSRQFIGCNVSESQFLLMDCHSFALCPLIDIRKFNIINFVLRECQDCRLAISISMLSMRFFFIKQ